MKLWKKYASTVKHNILFSVDPNRNLKYWRDDLFSNTIVFVLPTSIFAFIPSVLWALEMGYYTLTIIDVISVLIVIILGFKKGIKIKHRKLVFISTMYLLSFTLIYYIGLNSTLYLLASCFLSVFIYSFKNKYTPALINLYISIVYVALYYSDFEIIPKHYFKEYELLAVFSNLIFLSFLVCSLIPRLFDHLNESFQKTLIHTEKIENQNNLLKEITWIQSHVVRTPLSRLIAIAQLLKENDTSEEEKKFFLDNIIISSRELDEIIKEIVEKAENVQSND